MIILLPITCTHRIIHLNPSGLYDGKSLFFHTALGVFMTKNELTFLSFENGRGLVVIISRAVSDGSTATPRGLTDHMKKIVKILLKLLLTTITNN